MYGVNLVMNGDGESGPCEVSYGVTHPTWWSYSGGVTQIGARRIRRRTIRRGQFVADDSSRGQFVARQFVAGQFVATV